MLRRRDDRAILRRGGNEQSFEKKTFDQSFLFRFVDSRWRFPKSQLGATLKLGKSNSNGDRCGAVRLHIEVLRLAVSSCYATKVCPRVRQPWSRTETTTNKQKEPLYPSLL